MSTAHNSDGVKGKSDYSDATKKELRLRESLMHEKDSPFSSKAAVPFRPTAEPSFSAPPEAKILTPTEYEELTLCLANWNFKLRTPYVCENEFNFSFGVDDSVMSITPKFEAEGHIEYNGSTFPIAFAGGNIRLPGIPYTILSFLKIPHKS